jgi:hypothetical protein
MTAVRSAIGLAARFVATVAAVGVVFAACAAPEALSGEGDLLFLSTRTGMVALDGDSGRTILNGGYAVPSADWTKLVLTETHGRTTRVALHNIQTSARREVARVDGTLVPRVISRSGKLVALAKPGSAGAGAWKPVPKRRTELAVLRIPGPVRRFDLPGNFEPEAFTADDRTLVLIEYVPATRPDRYRLRELDVGSGTVNPLGARLKLLAPDEMKGTGRTQVPAPDGSALYTLYTRQRANLAHAASGTNPSSTPVHSFVHVLNLVRGFAHCVDLPHGFGAGPSAVALSSDGTSLFAVDVGRVVAVDTRSLRVSRAAPIRLGTTSSLSAAAQGGTKGALFIGTGTDVYVLDRGTLRVTGRYQVGREVKGLTLSSDGRRLFVALEDAIAVMNATTGAEMRTLRVPGITGIVAAVTRPGDARA